MEMNRMALAVPLSSLQIQAASKLHSRLKQRAATDAALAALGERFPDFGLEAVLLKVSSINQLYDTNLYAIKSLADYIARIMAQVDTATAKPELVEWLAAYPVGAKQRNRWTRLSFASRFAHFFIDPERFPPVDSSTASMVELHLGRRNRVRNKTHLYQAYVTNRNTLKRLAKLSCTSRELDCYLRLAGLYLVRQKHPKAQIDAEVDLLFLQSSEEVASELAQLLSPIPVHAAIGEH